LQVNLAQLRTGGFGRLLDMAEPTCPNCIALERRVAELEALVAKLLGQLEALQRANKRQAAPFSKAPPKQHPKTPGRKSGRQHGKHGHRPAPPPEQIDEKLEAPLPDACPECGGKVQETHVDQQYQTEIPRKPITRQFNIHCGICSCCGEPVQGRHPLQTSDATGAAASQLGPDTQAAIVYLNKHAGLSHGKIRHALQTLFGIRISRGASAQVVLRAGQRLQPAYEQIQQRLQNAAVITPDETGWRIAGHTVWLHAWVGDNGVTCYHIDPQRSADALQRLLGSDWSGSLVHDGWASYDQFEDACHQQCQAHVLRRARELEEAAVGRAKLFPRQVIDFFRASLALRDRFPKRRPSEVLRQKVYEDFTQRLLDLTKQPRANPANERLAAHLYRHAEQWFMFLLDPTIPATNYRGEQAIRPAVVNRKVWGGNRTPAGARAQAITMSVLQTCKQRAIDAFAYLSQTFRGFVASLFVPLRIAASR
jgi:transposase